MIAGIAKQWLLSRDGTNDGRQLAVTLPIRMVSEANMHENWRARHRRRKAHRNATALAMSVAVRAEGMTPPCEVTITRIAPCALDDDNLVGAAKAFRDGVADALGVDDRDKRIAWRYAQRKDKRPRFYAVEIQIRKGGSPR